VESVDLAGPIGYADARTTHGRPCIVTAPARSLRHVAELVADDPAPVRVRVPRYAVTFTGGR
jgi:hypothetical protein